MGLMTTLAPRRPGGVEKDIKPSTGNDMEADEDEAAAGPSSKTGAIPKGYGRIVRDAEGNVVDIVMGGEEAADSDDESAAFKADKGKARAEDTPVVTGASHAALFVSLRGAVI
jgi:nucleolar protein 16